MKKEYDLLRLKMFQKNVMIEKAADLLGVHHNMVANKLNGDSSFIIE